MFQVSIFQISLKYSNVSLNKKDYKMSANQI